MLPGHPNYGKSSKTPVVEITSLGSEGTVSSSSTSKSTMTDNANVSSSSAPQRSVCDPNSSQLKAPPETLSATMKSLELGASPSILSRQSSANTTPRQGNRRVAADDTSRKTAAALRRSLGTGSAVVPNNGSAIAGSTPLEAPMSTRANDAQSMHTNRVLPKPKHPSLCSLLCCFYAEFDIKVGPKIAYQSPDQFMEQNIRLEAKQMQKLLVRAFDKVTSRTAAEADSATEHESQASDSQAGKSSLEDHDMSCPLSIFDSCSEYIITGSELTGNIINLSTHHIHVLTRPTMISDEKYERNSLLFCVGFVLRRNDDPRPYRSVLSKLALTLRDMEIESEFLSTNRPQIQTLLEDVLVSLNSNSSECNLLLGKADVLNLKLFRPQETLGAPVKDYDVPILLRRDWQMHSYDRDLSINWVSLHIDGIANAKQISKRAEVDLEMVRACLRVLKHHNVIALVDMFCYSNRYECTNKCALDSKLLDEAVEFVVKRGNSASTTRSTLRQRSISPGPDYRNELELTPCPTDSSLDPVDAGIGVGSYPKMASGGSSRHEIPIAEFLKRDEIDEAKAAIAEFYCTCDRKVPIGEVWVSLVAKSSQRVNWQKMFQVLDHRRLIVFGLVQGVIQRIHNYPFLLRDYHRTQSGADGVAFLPTFDKPSGPHYHVKHNLLEERRKLVNRATSMMDGMHCDDHLVCTLDLSLDSILELFREENVVSVFAATDM